MAALVPQDVVKEAQSVGAQSLTGEIATPSDSAPAAGGLDLEPHNSSAEATSDHFTSSTISAPNFNDSVINGPSRDLSPSPFSKDTLADASGGSDTDTSRTDGVVAKDDGSGHMRTNSFKKPVSFKSVSVTKNFLAKANVPQSGARAGDKGALGSQSSPSGSILKPRLVAKSALGGLSSRGSLSGIGGSANSPDASKVWNKNRPPPAPVPRNYTDEELKQQYGIHMATRLGADDDGKEAKWADIDDDEDDWAPETVTWLDGTKSTVAPVETKPAEAVPPLEIGSLLRTDATTAGESQVRNQTQPSTSLIPETILSDSPHPKTPALASTKTILKPGSHVLAQKTAANNVKPTEKQIPLVVGSPAPVPAKSPWATLPPVDKSSPVTFAPPPHQQRIARDHSFPDAYQQATPLSPQEIEADDFHRFHNQSRRKELFNSQSGEFEPANDARRHSARYEQHGHRQPAVLQRGPHAQNDTDEPSPTSQGHRAGPDSPQWQRHRTGSIGSSGRRMSSSRPQDMSDLKPGSMPEGDAPAVQTNDSQQSLSNGQTDADAAAFMRESIEKARLAKQLRLQEEEQEEKARKERLRLKMAALAPATPSPSMEEAELSRTAKQDVTKSPHLMKATQAVASPPKPPVPTAKGEVAQYGLMKVHQSQPVKNVTSAEQHQIGRGNTEQRSQRRPSHGDSALQQVSPGVKSVAVTREVSHQSSDQLRPSPVPESAPWSARGPPTEGINGWASSNTANVWGPPQSKAKALGNGTFDNSGFRSLPGNAQGQRAADSAAALTGPGPIAPPSGQTAGHAGRPLPSHIERAHGQHGEISPPNSLGHTDAQKFSASPNRNYQHSLRGERTQQDKMSHAVGGPVRHPSSAHDSTKANAVPSAWNSLITPEDNQQVRREWQQQSNFDVKSLDRPVTPVYVKMGQTDTRRAILGIEGSQSRLEHLPSEKAPNGNVMMPGQIGLSPQGLSGRGATSLGIGAPPQSSTTLSQRPSRFFPRSEVEVVQPIDDSDSPPPPEISSLDSDTRMQSPRVHIPKVAIVKLPPAMLTPSAAQSTSAAASPGLPSSNARGDWQSKFNTLFKAETSSVSSVATSTRTPADHVFSHGAAAVSLPTRLRQISRPVFSIDKSAETQTRPLDEDLYPQPDFGSTPTIRLPPRSHASKHGERFLAPFRAYNPVFLRFVREREAELNFVHTQPLAEPFEVAVSTRSSYVVKLTKDATPKTVAVTPGIHRSSNAREGFKERRQNQEPSIGSRGGRRGGGSYASRGNGTGSLRGHSARGSFRSGANAAAKRNITAPVMLQ